jgi:hypothetical protein
VEANSQTLVFEFKSQTSSGVHYRKDVHRGGWTNRANQS